MTATRINVEHMARVEGHGDIRLVIEDGSVTTCEMAVVEPARLFESMVVGRSFEEVPYIASRVCGICSSSHVVTDIRAIEAAFGVEVTDRTEALRELLVYGSFLQNHATHLFVFAAPDFLGHTSVFPLADIQSCVIKKGMMGAVNCAITLKDGSFLKLQMPKRGGLGGGMPHHAEYREPILARLERFQG